MGAIAVTYKSLRKKSEVLWSDYRQRLEKDIFDLKWNHSRELSDAPRIIYTEANPYKPTTSSRVKRGAIRTYPAIKTPFTPTRQSDPLAPCTAYRLPRLPEDRSAKSRIQRDYIFKEPVTESQFLIKKDPRRYRKSPVEPSISPELRIKPRSTKCRAPPITADAHKRSYYGSSKWSKSRNAQTQGLPTITPTVSRATVKKKIRSETPPQSEVDYDMLPSIHIHRDTDSPEPVTLALGKLDLEPTDPFPTERDSAWERRLAWQLSPYDNKNFDKQGLGPNTGPFSRELTRTCMPPTNWLRMKLRQRLRAQLMY